MGFFKKKTKVDELASINSLMVMSKAEILHLLIKESFVECYCIVFFLYTIMVRLLFEIREKEPLAELLTKRTLHHSIAAQGKEESQKFKDAFLEIFFKFYNKKMFEPGYETRTNVLDFFHELICDRLAIKDENRKEILKISIKEISDSITENIKHQAKNIKLVQ
jgi:hypothetical protein